MKTIFSAIATTLLLSACATTHGPQQAIVTPATPAARTPAAAKTKNEVSFVGARATEFEELMKKAEAFLPDYEGCGMGTCTEGGEIAVSCKQPTDPKRAKQMSCSVTSVGGHKEVPLNASKSRQMLSLLETLNAVAPDPSPCGMGSCFTSGDLKIECAYPTNPVHAKLTCTVTASKREY